jgi:hypothetical protein
VNQANLARSKLRMPRIPHIPDVKCGQRGLPRWSIRLGNRDSFSAAVNSANFRFGQRLSDDFGEDALLAADVNHDCRVEALEDILKPWNLGSVERPRPFLGRCEAQFAIGVLQLVKQLPIDLGVSGRLNKCLAGLGLKWIVVCGHCVGLSSSVWNSLPYKMMAVLFAFWTGAFALAFTERRRASVIVGLAGLVITAAMFRYHLTGRVELGL